MFAKKLLTAVLVLGVISGTVYAADQFFENKDSKKTTIMFADSVLENGRYDKSDAWLTGSIKTSLLSSLKKYGGFNCIDLDEQKNVAVVQKKLSSSIYDDEDSSFEIGKLVKAKNIVNVKSVRMQSGAYRLSVTMLNVETGEVIGVVSLNQGYESAEIFAASAPIDAMPEVLKEFNVVLTSAGKSELKKETEKAHSEIIRLREIAEKNLAAERESDNVKLELLKLEREKEERRAVEEAEKNRKAEQAAAQKALEEKKQKKLPLVLLQKNAIRLMDVFIKQQFKMEVEMIHINLHLLPVMKFLL